MYRLFLFGGVSLEGPSGPVEGRVRQRHRLALLVLLAGSRAGHLSRDKLVGFLWPDRPENKARHSLADSVYVLRHELGEDAVVAAGDDLRLDPGVVGSDVAAFSVARTRAEEAEDDAERWARLEEMVALYRGPFLDGFHGPDVPAFEQWVDRERRRLSDEYGRALETLAGMAGARDAWPEAAELWKRRAAHEPTNSRVATRLMEALARSGDAAGALRHARVHELLLEERLGLPLPEEVVELSRRLTEAGEGPGRPPTAASASRGKGDRATREDAERAGGEPKRGAAPAEPSRARTSGRESSTPAVPVSTGGTWKRPWIGMALAVLLVGLAGVVVWLLDSGGKRARSAVTEEGSGVRRASILLPDSAPLAFVGDALIGVGRTALALSPDGERLAYVARTGDRTRLYVRELDRFDVRALPGTDGAYDPFFSPDGEWIGYFTGDTLRKVSVRTGRSVTLTWLHVPFGAAWETDDRILVADNQGFRLGWVPSMGGVLEALPLYDTVASRILDPEILPGDKWIVHGSVDRFLSLTSLETGERYGITSTGVQPRASAEVGGMLVGKNPHYLESGHIAYISGDGALMVLPFDAELRRVLGTPVPIAAGIRLEATTGGAQFTVSDDGTFVYAPGRNARRNRFVWVDHDTGSIDTLPLPADFYGSFRLSPDGRRILTIVEPATGPAELWVLDAEAGERTRVPTEGIVAPAMEWLPDGVHVVYAEMGAPGTPNTGVTVRQRTDGSRARDTVFRGGWYMDPFPDGDRLIVPDQGRWKSYPLDGPSMPHVGRNPVGFIEFSPDGRWLAFTDGSPESGVAVYVSPVGRLEEVHRVTPFGGEEAVWTPNGTALVYRDRQQWVRAELSLGETVRVVERRVLFEGPYQNLPGWSHDIAADGRRQLLLRGPEEEATNELVIVTNWLAEVERASTRRDGGERPH